MRTARAPARRRAAGFTLIELLVALAAMAVLAGLAWLGVDSMVRSREATQTAMDRTLRLSTVLTQWEQDFDAIQETVAVPALQFDGRTLRLTRSADDGVRVVTWTLREGAWWRWTSPVLHRSGDLQQSWMASQQHRGGEEGELKLLDGAEDWQIYFYRGNAWTNAQSSGNRARSRNANKDTEVEREDLPDGVRLVLTLGGTTLTRDIVVPPQPL